MGHFESMGIQPERSPAGKGFFSGSLGKNGAGFQFQIDRLFGAMPLVPWASAGTDRMGAGINPPPR